MKLKVLGSSSKGNCYILENDTEALIIEAGIRYKDVKIALDFDVSKIKGVIISHSHGDHAGFTQQYLDGGIKCYANFTLPGAKTENRTKIFEDEKAFLVGNFTILPFPVVHDVPNHAFVIKHKDMGSLLFVTDTAYISPRLSSVNHWLVECNHNEELMEKQFDLGNFKSVLAMRVQRDHFGLETLTNMFKVNDLSATKNIVLIHLSDTNSNEKLFKETIQKKTGKVVYIADKGLEVEL